MKPSLEKKQPVAAAATSFPCESSRLQKAFELCLRKTRRNIKQLADKPATWSNDPAGQYPNFKEDFYDLGNWTSSFFTGMALIAWRETEDEFFLNQTLRLAPHYREKVFTRFLDTHHDLGFLYSLYSVALYKLTGDKAHREVGLRAAEVLSQRFNPAGNYIRAWGRMGTNENDNMAIIDCMMNLPLLYWAAEVSRDYRYRAIAVRHADTTLKCFIRPDDSVFHAFRFDLKTGAPLGGDNHCGCAVNSHWARGTAWAIYGFALSYGYTNDPRYLEASARLARKFVASLDSEIVPVWDFRLPPGEPPLRDASAAAVAACGLQELAKHGAADAPLLEAKRALLQRLCAEDYLDFTDACLGVQKNGQIGGPRNGYSSWGDYFLMEALNRELARAETFW